MNKVEVFKYQILGQEFAHLFQSAFRSFTDANRGRGKTASLNHLRHCTAAIVNVKHLQ